MAPSTYTMGTTMKLFYIGIQYTVYILKMKIHVEYEHSVYIINVNLYINNAHK